MRVRSWLIGITDNLALSTSYIVVLEGEGGLIVGLLSTSRNYVFTLYNVKLGRG